MKVIKKNEFATRGVWREKIVCKECESLLEIEENDLVTQKDQDARDGTSWVCFKVFCPVCHSYTKVQRQKVPFMIKKRLTEKSIGNSFNDRYKENINDN